MDTDRKSQKKEKQEKRPRGRIRVLLFGLLFFSYILDQTEESRAIKREPKKRNKKENKKRQERSPISLSSILYDSLEISFFLLSSISHSQRQNKIEIHPFLLSFLYLLIPSFVVVNERGKTRGKTR